MSAQYMSPEEYDERSQELCSSGRYKEALELLAEGLRKHPASSELRIGKGYAWLACEEYVWARMSFEDALRLDPDAAYAYSGLAEVYFMTGNRVASADAIRQALEKGGTDDVDLRLQIGRACLRMGLLHEASDHFVHAAGLADDPASIAETRMCLALSDYSLDADLDLVMQRFREALAFDPTLSEARVYLANLLYEHSDLDSAFSEFKKTEPEDHWSELGIVRYLELCRILEQRGEADPTLEPWRKRLAEFSDLDDIELLLAEVVERFEQQESQESAARSKLQTLGDMLSGLAADKQENDESSKLSGAIAATGIGKDVETHCIMTMDGGVIEGSWESIVGSLRDAYDSEMALEEFMEAQAHRHFRATGLRIDSHEPEAFIRASAAAGMLRIVR